MLLTLSRALNQDAIGFQKEQTFMEQLQHVKMKWTEMGRPAPTLHGRVHMKEFKVQQSLYLFLTIGAAEMVLEISW